MDIDGDGDYDAFVGHWAVYSEYDRVRFFENTGPPPVVGGATKSLSPLEALRPWAAAAVAGLGGTVGAGAALLNRRRRRL